MKVRRNVYSIKVCCVHTVRLYMQHGPCTRGAHAPRGGAFERVHTITCVHHSFRISRFSQKYRIGEDVHPQCRFRNCDISHRRAISGMSHILSLTGGVLQVEYSYNIPYSSRFTPASHALAHPPRPPRRPRRPRLRPAASRAPRASWRRACCASPARDTVRCIGRYRRYMEI